MAQRLSIESSSIETLHVVIRTEADPTGSAPGFAITASGTESPGAFSDGSWSGSWDATTGNATAVTPTIGASGSTLELTQGSTYNLWWQVGVVVEKCAVVVCT